MTLDHQYSSWTHLTPGCSRYLFGCEDKWQELFGYKILYFTTSCEHELYTVFWQYLKRFSLYLCVIFRWLHEKVKVIFLVPISLFHEIAFTHFAGLFFIYLRSLQASVRLCKNLIWKINHLVSIAGIWTRPLEHECPPTRAPTSIYTFAWFEQTS